MLKHNRKCIKFVADSTVWTGMGKLVCNLTCEGKRAMREVLGNDGKSFLMLSGSGVLFSFSAFSNISPHFFNPNFPFIAK